MKAILMFHWAFLYIDRSMKLYIFYYSYMEIEIWKDIPWYGWAYQASTYWSVRSNNWKIHKWSLSKWYPWVSLTNKWKKIRYPVSRVIAWTFLSMDLYDKTPMNKDKVLVCHKDDNPLNNHIDNLFLWTPKQNSIDMVNKNRSPKMFWKKNPMFGKFGKLHHLSKKVYQYTLNDIFIQEFDSITEAEKAVWWRHVWDCCVWRYKTSKWYKFSFYKK